MKFRAERDALLAALTTAGRAAATRGGAIQALTGVHLSLDGDRLTLTGTDLDLTMQVDLDLTGLEPGSCVVPGRLATDIVRSLEPGAVTVATERDEATISSGRSQFGLRLFPAEEFLRVPSAPAEGEAVVLDAAALVAALHQVIPAASRDDARPILTGVLFEAVENGVRVVATDSYRLALRDLAGTTMLGADQKVLIPARSLGELARILDSAEKVEVRFGDDNAYFAVGDFRLTTRLIEGEFPNYGQLIPSAYPNRLVVAKDALLDAAKRVKLLARDAAPVRMSLTSGGIELAAITQDVGQAKEEVDARYEGAEMTVAFNPDFLVAGVDVCPGDEVVIELLDALKPATVRSTEADDGFLYLLMPVRVS